MGASKNVMARIVLMLAFFCALAGAHAASPVVDAAAEFDRANKLYEQGKFPEAVAAYESLARRDHAPASVWFNLGNAAFKSAQLGRAIAAYRMAERLTPRDPALRANLQFVRGKVYSDERTRVPYWKSVVRLASLNEWAMLTSAFFWAFCFVLACGETTRRRYAKTVLTLLTALLLTGGGLVAAVRDQHGTREAIVTAREVTARFGPLDESQSAFQLRDGAEVTVLDSKGDWLQVRDADQRTGWIRRDDAMVMPDSLAPSITTQATGAN